MNETLRGHQDGGLFACSNEGFTFILKYPEKHRLNGGPSDSRLTPNEHVSDQMV